MEIRIDHIDHIRDAARQFISFIGNFEHVPHVIAFYGGMGAGKTTFIKALCEELGVSDVVTSPTFAIVNEYMIDDEAGSKDERVRMKDEGISTIYHFDFYRIRRLEEVYDMGYEDYFYRADALCFIEWPELIEELLPDDALCVTISELPDGGRVVKC